MILFLVFLKGGRDLPPYMPRKGIIREGRNEESSGRVEKYKRYIRMRKD